MGDQLVLVVGAKGRSTGQDGAEARKVVPVAVQFVEQGSGESIADDEQEGDLLLFDQAPDVAWVEVFGYRLHIDGAARVPRAKAHPVGRAMHERRGEQGARTAPGLGQHAFEGLGAAAPEALDVGIGISPQHSLGHAGGAAGVEDVEIVGTPLHIGSRRGGGGESLLVPQRARQQGVARVVGHLQDDLQIWKVIEHFGEGGGQCAVNHDCRGVGVV